MALDRSDAEVQTCRDRLVVQAFRDEGENIKLPPAQLGHLATGGLRRRTHTPALLDAGYQDKRIQVPWWGGRTLSYSFPAR